MTRETFAHRLTVCAVTLLPACPLLAAPRGNRLTHLHHEDPYCPGGQTTRQITPQWVGEEGIKTVVVPPIDDMRDNAAFVDAEGRDAGLRLVDISADGRDDLLISNDEVKGLHTVFAPEKSLDRIDFTARFEGIGGRERGRRCAGH